MCSYRLNVSFPNWFESWSAAFNEFDRLSMMYVVATSYVYLMASTKLDISSTNKVPRLHAALGVQHIQRLYGFVGFGF